MPRYFLDTSALAKLYRKETGSAIVDRIFSDPASQHVISGLAIVEMESVFARKVKSIEAVVIARRRLEADLGRSRLLAAGMNDEHFRGARRLLIKHGREKPSGHWMRYSSRSLSGLKEAGLGEPD